MPHRHQHQSLDFILALGLLSLLWLCTPIKITTRGAQTRFKVSISRLSLKTLWKGLGSFSSWLPFPAAINAAYQTLRQQGQQERTQTEPLQTRTNRWEEFSREWWEVAPGTGFGSANGAASGPRATAPGDRGGGACQEAVKVRVFCCPWVGSLRKNGFQMQRSAKRSRDRLPPHPRAPEHSHLH